MYPPFSMYTPTSSILGSSTSTSGASGMSAFSSTTYSCSSLGRFLMFPTVGSPASSLSFRFSCILNKRSKTCFSFCLATLSCSSASITLSAKNCSFIRRVGSSSTFIFSFRPLKAFSCSFIRSSKPDSLDFLYLSKTCATVSVALSFISNISSRAFLFSAPILILSDNIRVPSSRFIISPP